MRKKVKRWISLSIRLAVVAAALWWLAMNTQWTDLKAVWMHANKPLLLAGIVMFGPSVFLISWRLKVLMVVHEIDLSMWGALRATFAGNFIVNTIPLGTTGGDTLKAWYLASETPRKHEAVTVVFFDRVIGVSGLIMLAGIILLLHWGNPAFKLWGQIAGLFVLTMVLGGVVYFSTRLRRLFKLDAVMARLPLSAHLQRIDRAIFAFRDHKWRVLFAGMLTVMLQVNAVMAIFVMGWALGLVGGDPLAALPVYLGYVPICFMTGALPIGLMEVTFQQLFSEVAGFGPAEAAISLSLMGRFMQLVWSLPGGITVLRGWPTVDQQAEIIEMEAEPQDPARLTGPSS